MNGIWISLKGSMNCGCKITDVVRLPDKQISNTTSPEPSDIFSHCYIKNRFHELGIGDLSRNVVEMIYRASSANPTRCSKNIKRVLKVNNSPDILSKFEKYRESVMLLSHHHHERHPRSTVDGNELLQFYGTTMSCCGKKNEQISQLCRNNYCRVCRIIQSGFDTSYNQKHGIRLSTNSEHVSEDNTAFTKCKRTKRAVIICRTIAGRVEWEQEDERFGNGLCAKPEFLIIRNSAAVLPCFVLVIG